MPNPSSSREARKSNVADTGEYEEDDDYEEEAAMEEMLEEDQPPGQRPTVLTGMSELVDNVAQTTDLDFLQLSAEQELVAEYALDDFNEDDFDENDPMATAISHFKKLKEEEATAATNREPLMIDEEDVATILDEVQQTRSVRRWMMFDSFFGVFVAANGMTEALSKEGLIDGDSQTVYLVSSGFCGVFIIELSIRWYFCGSFRVLMQNGWNRFDLIIISLSAIDLWILEYVELGSGGAGLAIIRVLRLVRNVRLLRLLREVKLLWFLVQSWIKAMPYLFWACVMICIICYTFGLLAFELIGQDIGMNDDSDIQSHWGNLRKSMLSLCSVATFDGGAQIARTVLEGQHHKRHFLFLFVAVIAIISIGLMNLMMGTVLTSCFELLGTDKIVNDATQKLVRHRALCKLEELFLNRCKNQIGAAPDESVLSRDLIFAWLEEKSSDALGENEVQTLFRQANVTPEDINAIFNEVKGIQGSNTLVRIHDFIQGCLFVQSEIHDLHLTQFISAQHSMHSRLSMLDEYLDAIDKVLNIAIAEVLPGLRKYAPTNKKNAMQVTDDGKEIEEDVLDQLQKDDQQKFEAQVLDLEREKEQHELARKHGFGNMAKAELLAQNAHKKEIECEKVWAQFDFVFLIAVLANGITLGIDCSKSDPFARNFVSDPLEGHDYLWLFVELSFAAIFFFEFFMRIALYYQMEVTDTFVVFLVVLPACIFDASPSMWLRILQKSPDLLRSDVYVCFDVLLLVLAFLDNVVLRFFFRDVKYLIVLRLFRTLRLMRVARVFYLLHDIASIVSTMRISAPIVLWNTLLLGGVMYVLAIFSLTIVKPTIPSDAPQDLLDEWSTLSETYLNMWLFPTFSDWGAKGKQIGDQTHWWVYLFFAGVATVTGLGILNLGTGIIIQQSFKYTAEIKANHVKGAAGRIKRAGIEYVHKLFKKLDAHYIRMKDNKKERHKQMARNFFLLWRLNGTRAGQQQLAQEEKQREEATRKRGARDESDFGSAPSRRRGSMLGSITRKLRKSQTSVSAKTVSGESESNNAFMPMGAPAAPTAQELLESVMHGWTECQKEPQRTSKDFLSSHNLLALIEDKGFQKLIKREGLRPDLLIMLFQRLDVLRVGTIDVDYFVEGLQRLMFPVSGIDIASTKSVARRLYIDALEMTSDAEILHETFLDITSKLRGITPLGQENQESRLSGGVDGAPADADDNEYVHEIYLQAWQSLEDAKNAKLKKKIERASQHLYKGCQRQVEKGDEHVAVRLRLDEGAGEDDELSITSATAGKHGQDYDAMIYPD